MTRTKSAHWLAKAGGLWYWTGLLLFLAQPWSAAPSPAQDAQAWSLREDFREGYQYHVDCRVSIRGQLVVPAEKPGLAPTRLDVTGNSVIKYDERILAVKNGVVDRTIRQYEQMDFERKVGKNDQHGKLRSEVRRLVILRKNHLEVPFSPLGPLLWEELDLVRTDVFTPALQGLLPSGAVRPRDSWFADRSAIQELTDLEKIDAGQSLRCDFAELAMIAGRPFARVTFEGRVRGIGEDGPAEHELKGFLYFDLTGKHLSYLTMTGTQLLLDKQGNPTGGRIEGTCVLSREATPQTTLLSEAALRGLDLEPNERNTLLLFDSPETGVNLLYPRHWHIAGVNSEKRQIGVENKRGSGMLISADALANMPTTAKFQQEVAAGLARQQLRVTKLEAAKTLTPGLESFAVDADANGKRVSLHYFLVRQQAGGAVLTANLAEATAEVRADVERIARTVNVRPPVKAP